MTFASDRETSLQDIKDAVTHFADVRDWQQFHSLKNLSMAISTEAAELMAHFRWIDGQLSQQLLDRAETAQAIRHELADVLLLLAEFASRAGVDITQAVAEKLKLNGERYPVERARGTARKYSEL